MKKYKNSRLWKVNSEKFKEIVSNSNSLSDIARYFNYSFNSAVFNMIKERIEIEKIDLQRLTESRKKQNKKRLSKLWEQREIPLSEILVENSTYTNNTQIKRKLIKTGLLVEKCAKCGIGNTWNGKYLSLQLDHINGVNNDNRIENLRILCPNCHSQTPTFNGRHKKIVKKCLDCGKSISKKSILCLSCNNKKNRINSIEQRKVKNRPSKEELLELILAKSFLQIGKDFGVSDNAIRKWCKSYDLPYRKKDIEEYKNNHLVITK